MWMKVWGIELKSGLTLQMRDNDPDSNVGCGGGATSDWRIIGPSGVVASGRTCRCGRGCCNRDCIVDDYGCHDTVIEQYRAV